MNKINFSKLQTKEDMIIAFNQLKDDYRQLFAINEDLEEENKRLKNKITFNEKSRRKMQQSLMKENQALKNQLDFIEEQNHIIDKLKKENERLTQGTTVLTNKIIDMTKENERLNNIIKNLDKMFEYYFLGNLKYNQDTVNTIYIKYVKLKELKEGK